MSYTAAPSPDWTNYARLYVTTRGPARLAHDAMSEQFPKGLKSSGNDGTITHAVLQVTLQRIQRIAHRAIIPAAPPPFLDDLNEAQALLSRLLEVAMPDSGEAEQGDSEASNDPEVQRKNPDNFQGQDRGKRMAGDRAPAGKLERILAAKTGRSIDGRCFAAGGDAGWCGRD